MNITTTNIIVPSCQLPPDTICLEYNNESLDLAERIMTSHLFGTVLNRLYFFILIGLLVNLFVFWKFHKTYKTLDIKTKVGFVLTIFFQYGIYLYMTYVKLLIKFGITDLVVFFIILLPIFYIMITYLMPIMDKILDKLNLF